MFSLQRLLGGSDLFFDLLEKSAAEARESVGLLIEIVSAPAKGASALDNFALLRRKDKRIDAEIVEQLTRSFVTPLEREDIEALSTALYKIPKTLEKFAERMLICQGFVAQAEFRRQTELLEGATDNVVQMVKLLRNPKLDLVRECNDKLQYFEGEADKLMLELLGKLYNNETNPVKVIALKDLHELLEKAIDRCRDAGNVILHIVLKNS
jgi:uncharacterized protein Yka (UPF0111/DUF47 family)